MGPLEGPLSIITTTRIIKKGRGAAYSTFEAISVMFVGGMANLKNEGKALLLLPLHAYTPHFQ